MKVAMLLRADAPAIYGGDSLAMHKLGVGLRALGLEVTVAPLDELSGGGRPRGGGPPAAERLPGAFDVLHLFNSVPLDYARDAMAWAQASGAAVIVSPLYYANFQEWFALGIRSTRRWQTIDRLLGRRGAWAAFRAFQTAKLPLVKVWHGIRDLLIRADCIACSTHWENRYEAQHFRLGREVRRRMRISPLGVDAGLYGRGFTPTELESFRARYGLAPGYLAQVARIEPKKNQHAVIEALADEDVPLVFVGQPSPAWPDYVARCREMGEARAAGRQRPGRDVRFLDFLPEEELPLLYAAAGAHILPSWVEMPGLATLEAAASGCRAISTAISSVVELLGDEGWYCDPFDGASIRAAVRAALGSPVPPGLRRRVLSTLNWESAARANKALYEEVVGWPRRLRIDD